MSITSIEEVVKHNTKESAWIIVDGSVYDITEFLTQHPGGIEILGPYLGKEATEAFKTDLFHQHSTLAHKMLRSYKIGNLRSKIAQDIFYKAQSELEDRINSIVDLKKPLLPQVISISPNLYNEWMHNVKPFATMRIFESDILESLTHYPWWVYLIYVRVYILAL